jgi:hypothetical protein
MASTRTGAISKALSKAPTVLSEGAPLPLFLGS